MTRANPYVGGLGMALCVLSLAPACAHAGTEGTPTPGNVASIARPASAPVSFDATRAWTHLSAIVAYGPRPPASPGSAHVRHYLRGQWEAAGAQVHEHPFAATTPHGPIEMTNIWAELPGAGDAVVIVSAHYDTKVIPDAPSFIGANDSASGVAILLALAEALGASRPPVTIWLVGYDGEEAYGPWSATDGIYGSRAFVAHLRERGVLHRIEAVINLDMVGDEHLRLLQDTQSTPWLLDRLWRTAADLGYGRQFGGVRQQVTDDHVPFLRAGVAAVDLIDFRYGPLSRDNRWWHTADDTPAHCRQESLGIVGDVVLKTITEWQSRN